MKKTVFSILIGLILFSLIGCKAEPDNSVTYNTVCITEKTNSEKFHLIYQPSKDNYQIGMYLSPSYEWYKSAEKDEANKARTFEIYGNVYLLKSENQPVYSKIEGSTTVYSYKKDNGFTTDEGLTCTLFSAYCFELKDPTVTTFEDEISIMIFTKDGKTYYNFVEEDAKECSYNENAKLTIINEKGKLFYKTNERDPLEEREYNGTTTDNGKLYYVVDTYVD